MDNKSLRADPETCLRHEATGSYCWPGDVLCANCLQIVKNRVADMGDAVAAKALALYDARREE